MAGSSDRQKRLWLFASKNRSANDLVWPVCFLAIPAFLGGKLHKKTPLDRASFNGSINGTFFC
jgi:hypothetical protein